MSQWDQRKKRLLKSREALPESLREIPLRYVEDVAGLSADALRALDRVYSIEPVNIPRALKYLRENLVLSIDDMLEFSKPEKPGPKNVAEPPVEVTPAPPPIVPSSPDPEEIDTQTLARLLQSCYPNMLDVPAFALAESDVMSEALMVVAATRKAIESEHAKSDFVILSLLHLFAKSKKQVFEKIQGNPAFLKALENSKVALD
jgi:hypothetical protein